MFANLCLFFAKIKREIMTFLKFLIWPFQLVYMAMEYRIASANHCRPLRSTIELLNFYRFPPLWVNLVEPLAYRCKPRFLGENFEHFTDSDHDKPTHNIDPASRPEVLVCHDLAGNYRDDRYVNGSKKWDDYRFYHWAGIDYFCYFSHQFVTIPTLAWINAAHRNGVRVLGTVIFESTHGRTILEEILKSEEYMKSIANALVLIANYCKFEGWLLNVECSLDKEKIPMLRDFVQYLTERTRLAVPNGKIIWYDSIIDKGLLSWQNELNDKNKMFFDVSDGILINYTWSENNLINSAEIVDNNPVDMKRIFIGIDVFGRGQVAKFQSNLTLAKIKNHNFSIGIFAPGWTFEATKEFGINITVPNGSEVCNTHFIERNDLFWSMLWRYLHTSGPSDLPFYTSFCLGSGKRKFQDGKSTSVEQNSWFNLSNQSWQPSVPSVAGLNRYFDDSFNGGSCMKLIHSEKPKRLFVTNFKCDKNIIFAYVFKRLSNVDDIQLWLMLEDSNGQRFPIVCGSVDDCVNRNGDEQFKRKYFKPLHDRNMQEVLTFVSEKHEKVFPIFAPINGWETRYYFLDFDRDISVRIIDIGARATHTCKNVRGNENGALLGAIHIHEGFHNDGFLEGITNISSWDFNTIK